MVTIKLTKNIVSGGKILLKGEIITVANSVDYSAIGELVNPPTKPELKSEETASVTEQSKRSRSKSESKPEKEVEDGIGDNP